MLGVGTGGFLTKHREDRALDQWASGAVFNLMCLSQQNWRPAALLGIRKAQDASHSTATQALHVFMRELECLAIYVAGFKPKALACKVFDTLVCSMQVSSFAVSAVPYCCAEHLLQSCQLVLSSSQPSYLPRSKYPCELLTQATELMTSLVPLRSTAYLLSNDYTHATRLFISTVSQVVLGHCIHSPILVYRPRRSSHQTQHTNGLRNCGQAQTLGQRVNSNA